VLINATWLRLLVRRTIRLLQRHGLTGSVPARRCVVRHDQFGGAYGRSTKAAEAAVELALAEEGLKLETTYTGKTLASLLSYCKDQGKGQQRLLFWNTYNSRDTTPLLAY
jgi:1-aminocyclopropane-1-carboxylate deaminase/D-cysteine desulfhydrase-like pyridoxal-dependent ACC family enzyme